MLYSCTHMATVGFKGLRICVIALTSEVILHSYNERILRMVQVNGGGRWVDLLASLTANLVIHL